MAKKGIFVFILLCAIKGFAQWNNNPTINTPVCLAPNAQNNSHAVSDTKGGIIVAWEDKRNSATSSTDIYAQRMKKNGFPKWTSNGVAICTNAFTQKSMAMTDGGIDGSAIITWEDDRAGNTDIYAQKIDSSGNVLWTLDGIIVCNKITAQRSPKIVSDNAGGAIIVWEDSVNFYWDIFAQHISSTGAVLWATSGVAVCAAPNVQNNPRIDFDGLGGAVIVWQDKRNNTDYDIYAQRLNASGATQWASNGVVVCNATNVQNNPRIEPDGSNGALISWVDKRNGLNYDIYAQRIGSTGTASWATNGIAVCTATNNQSAQDMKYLGANGVVITWKDDRNSLFAVYAQQLNLLGVPQLANDGILLSSNSSIRSINPNSITDGLGGSIIVWQDSTAAGFDIYTQRLNSAGLIQWPVGGVAVSLASNDQVNACQVTDGNGGAIFAWEDKRNTTDYEIYAHHIYNVGNANGINEQLSNDIRVRCYPNPISENSIIQLINNKQQTPWELSIYDAFGKQLQTQILNANETFTINPSVFSAGIYFYTAQLVDKSMLSKGSFISIK